MSGDATAWVFRHSPLKGTELLVHVAIADTVSEKHDWQLWASVASLAEKARCNRNTVREVLRKLEDDGYLSPLTVERGKACRYVFLMPDVAPVARTAAETRTAPETANVAPDCANPAPETPNPAPQARQNTTNTSEPLVTEPTRDAFAEFWTCWPRKLSKKAARSAWNQALKKADEHDIRAGQERWCAYWAEARTDEQYVPHAATWLNDERWRREPPAVVRKFSRSEQSDDAAKRVASAVASGFPKLRQIGVGG